MDLSDNVQKNKADKGLRFANLLIDTIIFYCSFLLLGFVVGFTAIIFGFDPSFFVELQNINPFLDRLITAFIMVFWF